MRPQILLLFVFMAADVVLSSTWTSIKFPLKLLQPDLEAISKYYGKIGMLHAFVQWPDSISFSIQMTKEVPSNEFFLKISGTFKITKMTIMASSYDGMYYRDGVFYVKDAKTGARKEILPDTKVTYIQPKPLVRTTNAYLSIRYFSLAELKEAVEPFYLNNKNYVDSELRHKPATFLASVPDPIGHFVEYTFWGADDPNTLADGKLSVLIGSGKKGKLIMTSDNEAFRLVFDQRKHIFTIPENFAIDSKPLENVFGVRMARKGFMAEVRETAVLMLNDDDLIFGYPITKQHNMFVHDLLLKVKTIEPRYKHFITSGNRPTYGKFQVHGQVFIKSVNYDKNGKIDHYCPFTIEYANKGRQFLFGDRWVDKIYTNDSTLWVEGDGPVPSYRETLSLMY